jgi:regulator of cell morphogenesis and NO signaling
MKERTTSTSPVTADTPLATIAFKSDAHAAVLDRHRLDFCCRGARTLAEACRAEGLDVEAIRGELAAVVPADAAGASAVDWTERSISELIDFIVGTHHAYTRTAIARIAPLLAKVVARHGRSHVELAAAADSFYRLADDMGPHMQREERVLFPYIRALASPEGAPPPPFGTIKNPVRMMMLEHDRAGQLLASLFAATGGFVTPPDACASYVALYAALAGLRLDLLRHVSLENNVLFPRALALEDGPGRDRSHQPGTERRVSALAASANGRTMRP